jgi:hypothetical protein
MFAAGVQPANPADEEIGMAKITVTNPVAQTATVSFPLAKRVPSLKGARVGLWWNEKPGGEVALEHAGKLLQDQFGVSLFRQYQNFPAPLSAREGVSVNADVVIGTTGD